MTTMIDFNNIEGPVYSGRPRGQNMRVKFGLDTLDVTPEVVQVTIPDSTYSITSSFFLGFFGQSILNAGTKDAFFKKYHFTSKPIHQIAIESYVSRALQAKNLFN